MTIDRDNRVKLLKNVGQYLIDNADGLIAQTDKRLVRQVITIEVSVELEMPNISITSEYHPAEAFHGVKWG